MNRFKTHFEYTNVYLVLGLIFFSYGIYSLNGYGNHDDIYRMLTTWRTLIVDHYYLPSRYQGYLVPEIIIGLSSQLGGFHLSNLVSAALSVSSLLIFYLLLIRIISPLTSILAVVAVGSNPFWIIASTTSTDYIYPVFFFMLGLLTLLDGKIRLTGLVFALAVSSRITYGPMVLLAFLFYFPYILNEKRKLRKRFSQGVVLFFSAASVLYLPVFIVSGMNLSFLAFADTSGGFLGVIVRFVYKNIYFWGLPTFILLLFFLFKNSHSRLIFKNPFYYTRIENLLLHAVFWCFIYNEVIFAKLPHQYQYLLPILFCMIYFVATTTKNTYLSLIFALNIVYCLFCNFDILDTYQTQGIGKTIHSDTAKINFSIKEGVLARDLEWRSTYQKHLIDDFNKKWQSSNFPPIR